MTTSFANNDAFSWGAFTNQFDTSLTVDLSGMRTMANNRHILADWDNSHTLVGDANINERDAVIYDLLYKGTVNLDNTTQRFANTFTAFYLGNGADVLDLTSSRIASYTTSVTAAGGAG